MAHTGCNTISASPTPSSPAPFAGIGGSPSLQIGTGPSGINQLEFTTDSDFATLPNISVNSGTGISMGCGILMPAAAQNTPILFGSPVQSQIYVQIESNGSVGVGQPGHVPAYASPSGLFTFGVRHRLELQISDVGSTNATISAYLDGQLACSGTYNVQSAIGTYPATLAQFQMTGGSTSTLDSFYCLDSTGGAPNNAPLLQWIVGLERPASNGTYTAWTPSSGSLYASVNNIPAGGDALYAADQNSGDRMSANMNSAITWQTVFGVSVVTSARQENAGGGRSLAAGVLQSGSDSYGSTIGLSTSYAVNLTEFSKNPNTSANWTVGDLAATQVVLKVAS